MILSKCDLIKQAKFITKVLLFLAKCPFCIQKQHILSQNKLLLTERSLLNALYSRFSKNCIEIKPFVKKNKENMVPLNNPEKSKTIITMLFLAYYC